MMEFSGGDLEGESAVALQAAMQEMRGFKEIRERTEEMVSYLNLIIIEWMYI
jgi:hypothetical protein